MTINKNNTKILLFDIETAPSLGYVWGKWEQNVIEFERDWYILSFACKWLNGKKTAVCSLPDFKGYKKNPEDDKLLVAVLWKLFNEADIIIGHNGDAFDIKKANARFLTHGLLPPSPYKTVDTLKLARKYFKFDSNKLDDLAKSLNIGRKENVGGFATWKGCMTGDKKSWKKMTSYNKMDVELLEKVYNKLKPWSNNHPNVALLNGKTNSCPICGSDKVQRRGYSITKTNKFQRIQCQSCSGWSRLRLPEKIDKLEIV